MSSRNVNPRAGGPSAAPNEDIIDPALPVIDSHHHIWDVPDRATYLTEDFLADVTSGHHVAASVYVQCNMGYRVDGPREMQPVGETEFAARCADDATRALGRRGICDGIVAHADLRLGDRVEPVLDAHATAGGDRFTGIRHLGMWDIDATALYPELDVTPDMYMSRAFRRGFAYLANRGLTFDAGAFHPQLPQVADLAREFEDTPIVVNHVGYPIGMGRFSGRHDEVREQLRVSYALLAERPNIVMKFGGFGSRPHNIDFGVPRAQRTSQHLAAVLDPYFGLCLDAFGADRVMFETNYPVDNSVAPYATLWNTFKRLTLPLSSSERSALLSENARRVYRLPAA